MANDESVDSVNSNSGRPWTVVATFSEYGPAHSRAEQLRAAGDMQVKVKHIAAGFTVRTRQTSTSAPSVESKASKARTKAKDRRAKESESED